MQDYRHKAIQITPTGQLLSYAELRKYSDALIETGCAAGDGVQRAIDAGFPFIISIEAAPRWFQQSKERFSSLPTVTILEGKSTDILPKAIAVVNDLQILLVRPMVIFFLDAHPSGPESAGHAEWVADPSGPANQDSIIKAELAIILTTDQRHVIIIDDVNGITDGCALQYCSLVENRWPGSYDFFFYDENLSGDLLYQDKILVCVPKS